MGDNAHEQVATLRLSAPAPPDRGEGPDHRAAPPVAPPALVAAWVYAELQDLRVSVTVAETGVVFTCAPDPMAELRGRVGGLLSLPRFTGWHLEG